MEVTIIEVSLKAEALYGLIEKRNANDQVRLRQVKQAYYEIIAELRSESASIWLIDSEDYPKAFVTYYAPLRAHFRRIHDNKIGVIDFQEIM